MNNTIDYNGVQITLTPEQVVHIERETKKNKYKYYTSITLFADACDKLGLNPTRVYNAAYNTPREIALRKLEVIIRALNDGWVPNWNDLTEYKYWTYFRMDGGFSCCSADYGITLTDVPATLCFKTREIAEYAAKHFTKLYEEYIK